MKSVAFQGLVIMSGLLVASVATVEAKDIGYKSFDVPGAIRTEATGINARGDITGAYWDSSNRRHGFLLSNGLFTFFDHPDGKETRPFGINAQGQIVGFYIGAADNRSHGFLRQPSGDFELIDFPLSAHPSEPEHTWPVRITATGKVVGCFHDATLPFTEVMHGFLYEDGNYSYLPQKGTMSNGVTRDGSIVVGSYWPTLTTSRSFAIVDGLYTTFDPPGALTSAAWDVNPSGDIVGAFSDSSGTHGYLLNRYGFTTLDFPGARNTSPRGMNPQGDIVGFYTDQSGKVRAFVATRSQGERNTIRIP